LRRRRHDRVDDLRRRVEVSQGWELHAVYFITSAQPSRG
jgi:hypothetical protein